MNPLEQLNQLGQSVWYDNISCEMLAAGGLLSTLIKEDDLRGVTSNPVIYDQAIRSGHYDQSIRDLQKASKSAETIFYDLAIADIQKACDLMLPVYQKTEGLDGYVSLEVSPNLAFDVIGTITEAKALWRRINRKNAMIKIPATIAGIEAMSHLISEGININMTLIFSIKRYLRVIEGYLSGLEARVAAGRPINNVASVASFFISRIDAAIDPKLADIAPELQGTIAISNAKMAHAELLKHFGHARFDALSRKGGRIQRLLWASTGTKNATYSDTLYVDALIGAHTINTMPPATYAAYKDHGTPNVRLEDDLATAEANLRALSAHNIDLESVTQTLEKNGIEQFTAAFNAMMMTINEKLSTV
ncbi:transaldolase [Wohlfahrtiimonas chitiniclastica]|uniref:transaldolase n=1 Tax=Wohlfahrtiimonas chitiniclastica TaxID=400946 RepID=UPI000B9956FA|nr:transaldolase [Wohlfahrtiimonas chitiniclastica]OYQ78848.1 transaldolase [Wohlfahrtiimonas chitiniclastica]